MTLQEKATMISQYLRLLEDPLLRYRNTPDVDHLNGFENPSATVPEHLTGDRFFYFRAGQEARKLRNRHHSTLIMANKGDGTPFSKTYKGRLSHRAIVKICEREEALGDIRAILTDHATGKAVERNIGY